MADDPGSRILPAERDARRSELQEKLAQLSRKQDPQRTAFELMRALDAYLEARARAGSPSA